MAGVGAENRVATGKSRCSEAEFELLSGVYERGAPQNGLIPGNVLVFVSPGIESHLVGKRTDQAAAVRFADDDVVDLVVRVVKEEADLAAALDP